MVESSTVSSAARRIMERADAICQRDPLEHGVGRVVFTPEHIRAREALVSWARDAGLRPSVDGVGNFWFLPASGSAPRFLMGSHFDSVPRGGRYDGALGVLLALEVAGDRCGPGGAPNDVAVVDFIAEESSRFGVGTVGSSVYAGTRSLEQALALEDSHGVAFGSLRPGLWTQLPEYDGVDPRVLDAYLEVHVDQATDLVDARAQVAVIDAIAAPTRWRVAVRGVQAHSGSAPMAGRHDALLAAAELIQRVNALARSHVGSELRATVGALDVLPNAANVIAGEAVFIVDLRVLEVDDALTFGGRFGAEVSDVMARHGVTIEVRQLLSDRPAQMDGAIAEALAEAAAAANVAAIGVSSWSAHDAMHVASLVPSGMLLVRNVGGVSHSPQEAVDVDDVDAALKVARGAIERLSGSGRR